MKKDHRAKGWRDRMVGGPRRVYITEDGADGLRLTKKGQELGRALAIAGGDDAAAVLDGLLDEQG